MATRAPLPVAQFAAGAPLNVNAPNLRSSKWRDLFEAEDAVGIWDRLATFVRTQISEAASDADNATQEIFLEIVATNRPKLYLDAAFSESMIEDDLRLLCARRH